MSRKDLHNPRTQVPLSKSAYEANKLLNVSPGSHRTLIPCLFLLVGMSLIKPVFAQIPVPEFHALVTDVRETEVVMQLGEGFSVAVGTLGSLYSPYMSSADRCEPSALFIARIKVTDVNARMVTAAVESKNGNSVIREDLAVHFEELQNDPAARFPNEPIVSEDLENSVNSIGMNFVQIPSGTFTMGMEDRYIRGRMEAEEFQHERPAHTVTISSPFWISQSEVTQRQWIEIMGTNPSHFVDCGLDCPVENVSWNEVQQFITKLNEQENTKAYRLPTEAEWEYVARAGTSTPYFWGSSDYWGNDFSWNYCNAHGSTQPVSTRWPNPWGMYDISGNVGEWVSDWWQDDYYAKSPERDPAGPRRGKWKVVRGGSIVVVIGKLVNRAAWDPDNKNKRTGFRLVREI